MNPIHRSRLPLARTTTDSSSSNPWVLAELQQALRHAASAEREESSEETSDEISWGNSDEVVVVRVALPSAAEREQVRATRARHVPFTHSSE